MNTIADNNRNARRVVFAEDTDRKVYLGWLKEATEKYTVNLHAYVLMDNHVHLLLSANEPNHISKVMQHIGRKYDTPISTINMGCLELYGKVDLRGE